MRSSRANRKPGTNIGSSALLSLVALLSLPIYASTQMVSGRDLWILLALASMISVFAFFAYRGDKRRAEAGEWRVPESTLHILSLLGGWPGAFMAQRVYRHKTSKASFQFVFWCVVLFHQFIAIDSVLDWRFTSDAFQLLKQQIA